MLNLFSFDRERCGKMLQMFELQMSRKKYIVKTPTTTSIQLKTTLTAVGFDVIMTLHTPPQPTQQELYSSIN